MYNPTTNMIWYRLVCKLDHRKISLPIERFFKLSSECPTEATFRAAFFNEGVISPMSADEAQEANQVHDINFNHVAIRMAAGAK